jgi:GT2 family glycosyltransferase
VAPAWNTGWKANPRADFYCWINADCEVTSGWSFPLVANAEQMPVIAMPFTNGVKSDGIGITGWCFVASRETAEKIGYFDETFVPAQYEDTDWFHRAIYQHQIALVNLPVSNVIHERQRGGSRELPNFNTRWKYLHMSNRFRYAWKHGVDPNDSPPFWKSPLPDVELEENNAS